MAKNMQEDTSELSDKVSKADTLKRIGRSIGRAALHYAPGILVLAAIGGTCGGFAAKIKHDVDRMSPELKSCYEACYERYRYDIKRLKEIDEKHNCSSYWWEQSTNEARDIRTRCVDRCDEEEEKKKMNLNEGNR